MTRWHRLENLLDVALSGGVFQAAAAGVIAPDGDRWVHAVGRTRSDPLGEPVTRSTLFDLASLTKVLATTGITARLAERKILSLDGSVADRMGALPWNDGRKGTTVRDLLCHRASFPAWSDFSTEAAGSSRADVRRKILERIVAMPLTSPLRSATLYSDLGFILLGAFLEDVSGTSFHELFQAEVTGPLGSPRLLFDPAERGEPPSGIAATEDLPERGGVVHGSVHDGNAFLLGGAAGHAGLFGDAEGCLRVADGWIASIRGGSDYLTRETAVEFITPVPSPAGSIRALGWDIASGAPSAAGGKVPPGTIGHLGFTGTSLWIDPNGGGIVALLTNRVHPTSKNDAIRRFRPAFHDAVWEVLEG